MNHAAIEVRALRKSYRHLHALQGVDLRIEAGEFFGLLGPNGAGKSTLINILAGLVRRSSGEALVLGHDVERDYRFTRQALGVVPQELTYDPFFSVREFLRLQSGYFGLGRNDDWIDQLLAALDLIDKADTNMRALSGGMKRRVMIAQALVHKPQVLILDEPTAGVDIELRQGLWRFIRQLNAEGHTIVLTTHYLEEAESLCDRIAILREGQLVALDHKQDLLARHTFKKLAVTTDQTSRPLPPALQALLHRQDGDTLIFHYDTRQCRVGDLLQDLQSAGIDIIDIRTEQPGLEDVFVAAMGDHA